MALIGGRESRIISVVEYQALRNAFFNAVPRTGNLMSWYYQNHFALRDVLSEECVEILRTAIVTVYD